MDNVFSPLFIELEAKVENGFRDRHGLGRSEIIALGAMAANVLEQTRNHGEPRELLFIRPRFQNHVDKPYFLLSQFINDPCSDRRREDHALGAAAIVRHLVHARW